MIVCEMIDTILRIIKKKKKKKKKLNFIENVI